MNPFSIALRRLTRTKAFSLVAVLTLALGLGAVTAALTLVQSVLLRPLPYAEPASLVRVLAFDRKQAQVEWLSWAEAMALRDESRSLRELAVSTVFPATLRTDEGSVRVERGFVSFNYFRLLGVDPVAGSLFADGDEQQVLVSERLWRRRWSAEPGLVGRSLELDGRLYTVAGVLPDTVYTHDLGSAAADLWLPRSMDRTNASPHFRIYTVVGRLQPGATLDQTRGELESMQGRLALEQPDVYGGWGAHADSLRASMVGEAENGLLLLLAAVGLVLLIVCVNLANLMLSRFVGRRREIATSLALGSGTARILRDASVEGGILALLGGGLGAILAMSSVELLPHVLPFSLPRQSEIAADARMLGTALACAALATSLFAVLPVVGILRSDLSSALRAAGRGTAGAGGDGRLRRLAIVAQVALSIPLLVAAGLLTQSLLQLGDRDLGMQPDGLVAVNVSVPFDQYREADDRIRFFGSLLAELRARPGIESAGATLQLPFVAQQADRARFRFIESDERPAAEQPRALLQVVTDGYFETLGTRLVEGRLFDSRDEAGAAPVAIVSAELARRELEGRSPLGLHVETEFTITPDDPPVRRVIGVVEDIPHFGPRAETEPQIFFPHTQSPWPAMGLVLRTRLPAEQAVARARAVALELEPSAVVGETLTLRRALDATLGQPRFYSRVLLVFAAAATLLAGFGLYGLLSFAVTARTRELGLRAALGAEPGSLVALVLRGGVSVTLAGVGVGLAVSIAAVRLLQSLLYGVRPLDPATFAAAALVPLGIALAAAWLPARRAAAVDPVEALRGGE